LRRRSPHALRHVGAIHDWLQHRDMDRTELRDLLLGSLAGAVAAAGEAALPAVD